MNAITSEIQDLKERLKANWSAGDYGVIAENLQSSAEKFLARIPIAKGSRVLDVACGTGQVAFPAFSAGAYVTGIDIVPDLIEQARNRASAENKAIHFDVGDVEDMPYKNNEFDLVVSLIGAMFAPRPDVTTSELLRVCRPGGRIVMGNWTPDGFIGEMFKTVNRFVPPSPFMESPIKWGIEEIVRERFSTGIAGLKLTKRYYPFRYPFSPYQVVEYYREYFGPITRAFEVLDEKGQAELHKELEDLWSRNNIVNTGNTVVDAEILEVVAVRE